MLKRGALVSRFFLAISLSLSLNYFNPQSARFSIVLCTRWSGNEQWLWLICWRVWLLEHERVCVCVTLGMASVFEQDAMLCLNHTHISQKRTYEKKSYVYDAVLHLNCSSEYNSTYLCSWRCWCCFSFYFFIFGSETHVYAIILFGLCGL